VTLVAGTQLGKYVVLKKLAEGGMAEIYLATSQGAEGFEKEVVIKRIRSFLASDPGFVDMFIAEARLASRLNHANVVQIFDFAKHEDTYYLAMEYVRGCTLWDLRKRCKELLEPMPPVLVAHIGAEVARGLHYAHRLKVNGEPLYLVHRDVTPHNVLISFDGAVKLTDFGIAKAGNKLTSPGMLKGKFAYMAPEQSRGENVDVRTDVFALGIVLWEMLTGGRLFDGETELAVLRAVQQSTVTPPSRLNPDVPGELNAVVMKALERDSEARYQTAGELERALVQVVLNHAQSPDDTDVATFVRRVYVGGVPSVQALPAMPERTQQLKGAQQAEGQDEPVPREPTAVLPGPRGHSRSTPGGGEGGRPSLSPDEDVHAPTHLLPAREATPGKSMPAVQASPSAGEPEPPRYEPTQALPTPSPSPSAPPAERREAPAPSRRIGMGVGIGVMALFAAVGVGSLFHARTQEPAPVSSAPQNPGTVASAPSEAGTPPVATPQPPAAMHAETEPAQAAADAGTGTNPAVAAAAPPAQAAPSQPLGPSEANTPAKPIPTTGNLVVRAVPFATVLVTGANVRQSAEVQGQRTFKLAPGSYKVTFQHPKGTKTESVTVEPNSTVTSAFRAR
jgi:serine/threonine-protein kinase